MKITKQQCLKAVAKEPLRPGLWIQKQWSEKLKRGTYNKKCQVCAVGAVLRTCGVKNSEIQQRAGGLHSFGPVTSYEQYHLTKGNYLNALSCYYESYDVSRKTLARQRKLLAAFITEHFPDRFEVAL